MQCSIIFYVLFSIIAARVIHWSSEGHPCVLVGIMQSAGFDDEQNQHRITVLPSYSSSTESGNKRNMNKLDCKRKHF